MQEKGREEYSEKLEFMICANKNVTIVRKRNIPKQLNSDLSR